jgi:hypothetical protein
VRFNAALVFAAPAARPMAIADQALSQTLSTTDSNGRPFATTLTTGDLPTGVLLCPAGVLEGTITTEGAFSFTVQAADPQGATATHAFTLKAESASIFCTAKSLLGFYQVGAPAFFAVVAENRVFSALSCALSSTNTLLDD